MSATDNDDDQGPLEQAQEAGRAAAERGFDWDDRFGPLTKIHEELRELEEEIRRTPVETARVADELGDLLFSVVNLARHLDVDAAEALKNTVEKFDRRLQRVYELAEADGGSPEALSIEALESLWQQAKHELG